MQSGALLDRCPPEEAARLLTAPGSPGATHLAALGVNAGDAPALVRDYLASAPEATEARVRTYRAALLSLVA